MCAQYSEQRRRKGYGDGRRGEENEREDGNEKQGERVSRRDEGKDERGGGVQGRH